MNPQVQDLDPRERALEPRRVGLVVAHVLPEGERVPEDEDAPVWSLVLAPVLGPAPEAPGIGVEVLPREDLEVAEVRLQGPAALRVPGVEAITETSGAAHEPQPPRRAVDARNAPEEGVDSKSDPRAPFEEDEDPQDVEKDREGATPDRHQRHTLPRGRRSRPAGSRRL